MLLFDSDVISNYVVDDALPLSFSLSDLYKVHQALEMSGHQETHVTRPRSHEGVKLQPLNEWRASLKYQREPNEGTELSAREQMFALKRQWRELIPV